MRNTFEPQLKIGCLPIQETEISLKLRDSLTELFAALLMIYKTPEYKAQIFNILEEYILKDKKATGRKGMTLWEIFVLSQVRLCENISYAKLHAHANTHLTLRSLLGVGAKDGGFTNIEFEYQNIYDNVTLLNDEMVNKLNEVIIAFGHKEVFKKKEEEALHVKSDSFVTETNVHFPTDYNLLWDSARKSIETLSKFLKKYDNIKGWRKLSSWQRELKGLMRELGKSSASGGKNKEVRVKKATKNYLTKVKSLLLKLEKTISVLPIDDNNDLSLHISLEYFMRMMVKHIDLVERRIIKGETILHSEKLFSIFETYTEWVTKGKQRPNVELGKKVSITTDQYNLIIDHQIMENEQDRDIVLKVADRILSKHKVEIWSFDKGYWNKDNKSILSLEVQHVIMPKLGKKTISQREQENTRIFKKYKNKHSAIESNINELEHRGLDRCPDRGYEHFKTYVSLAVCAYNLKKIGKYILMQEREKEKQKMRYFKQRA